jgi:hypothetical protein
MTLNFAIFTKSTILINHTVISRSIRTIMPIYTQPELFLFFFIFCDYFLLFLLLVKEENSWNYTFFYFLLLFLSFLNYL